MAWGNLEAEALQHFLARMLEEITRQPVGYDPGLFASFIPAAAPLDDAELATTAEADLSQTGSPDSGRGTKRPAECGGDEGSVKARRREVHNSREQTRRNELGQLMEKLGDRLRELGTVHQEKRLSKKDILEGAIHLIEQIESTISMNNDRLRSRAEAAESEVRQLKWLCSVLLEFITAMPNQTVPAAAASDVAIGGDPSPLMYFCS